MFNTERFIVEVEVRPPLYDISRKDYTNREVKEKCWAEIGEIMFDDWNFISSSMKYKRGKEMIKKWKAVRDNFVKAHKHLLKTDSGESANKKRKYVYYDQLQFLIPHVRGNVNSCTKTQSETTKEEHPEVPSIPQDQITDIYPTLTSNAPVASNGTETPTLARPRKRKHGNRKTRRPDMETSVDAAARGLVAVLSGSLAKEEQADIYGHKSFMISFVPILNDMPIHAALQARQQISKLISDLYRSCHPLKNRSKFDCLIPTTASLEKDQNAANDD